MFKREHHIHISTILQALNAKILEQYDCFFGGGTAIVLSHNEYRESVDIDFLVSSRSGYQKLRTLLTGSQGINSILRPGIDLKPIRDIRADQYGLRTLFRVAQTEIKFEIVLEGRIQFEKPSPKDRICGIKTLTSIDLAASKLLANSDRWSDDSVFSRDIIDLAMLKLTKKAMKSAIIKAEEAYGESVKRDLKKSIQMLSTRKGRLEVCMINLKIDKIPVAVLWQSLRDLKSVV